MSVKELHGTVPSGENSRSVPVSNKAAERLHLVGSMIVTGGVAALLAVIAIPISLGLGAAGGARSAVRRMRRR